MKIESKSVIRFNEGISCVNKKNVSVIKDFSVKTKYRRSRICFHSDNNDTLHEMHICVKAGSYIRPAKHLKKIESLLVIDGLAKLFLFSDCGHVQEIIELGPYGSNRIHYYRLNEPIFHTLFVETNTFIFHEVAEGPFIPEETELAPWSPSGDSELENAHFNEFLKNAELGAKF